MLIVWPQIFSSNTFLPESVNEPNIISLISLHAPHLCFFDSHSLKGTTDHLVLGVCKGYRYEVTRQVARRPHRAFTLIRPDRLKKKQQTAIQINKLYE